MKNALVKYGLNSELDLERKNYDVAGLKYLTVLLLIQQSKNLEIGPSKLKL